MRRRAGVLLAVGLAVGLVGPGCGGGDDEGATATTAAGPAATAAGQAGALGMDPCDLLSSDVAARLVGGEVASIAGGGIGRALACNYAAADATGADAERPVASLSLEERGGADLVDQVKTQAENDAAADDGEATDNDLGDGGVTVVTETRIQVVYVIQTVVVTVLVAPADGEVSDADATAVVEFTESTIDPVAEAIGAGTLTPTSSAGATEGPTTTAGGEIEVPTSSGDFAFTPGTVDLSLDDLVGTFSTTYGVAEVRRDGDVLHAVYDTDEGTITFTLDEDNDVFRGWWTESPSRDLPDDAGELFLRGQVDQTGALVFLGEWRYATDGRLGGWNFTPAPEETPPAELVALFDDPANFVEHP